MSRARHSKKAGGSRAYAGGGAVFSEATEKKHGGKVVGKAPGAKSKPRMDKRARGGRIATPTSPFSSASSPSPKSMA